MRPLRVVMTADTIGGVWTYALELARGLAPRGVAITLVTMGPHASSDQREQAARIPGLTLVEVGGELEWMDAPWEDVDRAGERLLEVCREVRPDVVHLNGYAHAHLPLGAPTVVVAHSCVCSWWRAVLGSEAPARYDTYRSRVRRGLLAADAVVAPTRAFLALLDDLYGRSRLGVCIPNGIDQGALPRPGHATPLVLAAGRVWDRAKNLAILDQVAGRLPWPVQVAGDPTPPQGTPVRLEHVETLGKLPRAALRERMQRAAVFCHPARYEPFGLAPLEAAAAGCALVLGDLPTLREVWRDAALYVPPDDAEAIVRTLRGLADDPERLAVYGRRARRRAGRFDTTVQADAYLGVYRHVGGGHTHRVPPESVHASSTREVHR